jgi:large conductance mechanosensitive channel
MSMMSEFKDFAVKGSMVDMATGIIIGAATATVVASLVSDIIMPIVGMFLGGVDFSNMFVNLGGGNYSTLAAAQEAGAATLNYGNFINEIIVFLIILFVIFLMIKKINTMKKEEEDAGPPADIALLTEMRDLMKKR